MKESLLFDQPGVSLPRRIPVTLESEIQQQIRVTHGVGFRKIPEIRLLLKLQFPTRDYPLANALTLLFERRLIWHGQSLTFARGAASGVANDQ